MKSSQSISLTGSKTLPLGPLQSGSDPRQNLDEFLTATESSLACAVNISNGSSVCSVDYPAQLLALMIRIDQEIIYLSSLCDFV
jgi:hypothetical protein